MFRRPKIKNAYILIYERIEPIAKEIVVKEVKMEEEEV
jgi:hypothetical protein